MNQSNGNEPILTREFISLGLPSADRFTVIRDTGAELVARGCVTPEYIDSMIQREIEVTNYLGLGLALPHCKNEGRVYIRKSGIVVHQYPSGIDFGGETAYIVIAVAGSGDDHLNILQNIATVFMDCDEPTLQKLYTTDDVDFVYNLLMPR